MIYSQIFHQILCFPSEKNISEKKVLFKNFNISENNITRVELAEVLGCEHLSPCEMWMEHHLETFQYKYREKKISNNLNTLFTNDKLMIVHNLIYYKYWKPQYTEVHFLLQIIYESLQQCQTCFLNTET
jgi:hypothetical protein